MYLWEIKLMKTGPQTTGCLGLHAASKTSKNSAQLQARSITPGALRRIRSSGLNSLYFVFVLLELLQQMLLY